MSWYSIREFTERMGVSASTVRRQIQEGKLFARKFGKHWYIQPPSGSVSAPEEPAMEESFTDVARQVTTGPATGLSQVIDFSSKALHHYLIMSEKLIAEKDQRLAERESELREKRQELAELEAYMRLLEGEVERLKIRKPDGWM